MVDVFVSYKREDKPKIDKLVLGIQKQGLKVWFDAQARISYSFIEEINTALNECKCVIVVWSSLSVRSRFVRSEAYHAYERERLIPIIIEDVQIPVPFNELQAVDFRGWTGDFGSASWAAMIEAVRSYSTSNQPAPTHEPKPLDDEPAASTSGQLAFEEARSIIVSTLERAGQPITSAALAHIVRSSLPQHIKPFDWCGHKRFGDLIAKLHPDGVELDPRPPGLVKLNKNAQAPPSAPLPSSTIAAEEPAADNDFVHKLFETTEAPLLRPEQYRLAFKAIATSVRGGAKTISEITRTARDTITAGGGAISRDKLSHIYKGALIGGLKLDDPFVNADKVGYGFAQAIHDECGGLGWQMSPHDRDKLLGVLGLADR